MHRSELFALERNLVKGVSDEPQEHHKVATVRRHTVLEVGHHNVAVEEDMGLVMGRHTALEEERRIALVEERRIALAEVHHTAAVDTAPEAGCMAAVDKGSVKEHHRVAEAEDSLEVAGQAADSPVVGHIRGQAKNRNPAVAGGIGHVAAADNLLKTVNTTVEGFSLEIKRLTGSTAVRGVPWPTLRRRIRHNRGEGMQIRVKGLNPNMVLNEAELTKI